MSNEVKPPVPKCNVTKAAAECKKFLERKKFDMVDYSFVNIECYPPPDSKETPELKKFAALFNDAFDYAEAITVGDKGEGFPHDLIKAFEDKLKEVEAAINTDVAYWESLRSTIMPLYEKSQYFDEWKKRWSKVELFFDPVGLDVTTTEMFTNKTTGERVRGEIKRQTKLPPGFVIRVH